MKTKKAVIFFLIIVLLISFIPNLRVANANEDYGLVATEEGEMYKDLQGNLFPVIVVNGEKNVKLNEYELAPLEELLKRDMQESKGKSALKYDIISKYKEERNFLASNNDYYVILPFIYSYNQRYKKWGNVTLGFGPDTIAESGCFLTSCAMMLATYNLKINGETVDPLNLNTWMKNNGGFVGDSLVFGAIAKFPGINSIGYFDSFSDAEIAIYYKIIPILFMKPEHFSPLVRTNGVRDRSTNWIMNTYSYTADDYNTNLGKVYAPYANVPYYQTVQQSGYDFSDSSVFRTAYPN